jgi:hypothetical protein
VRRDAIRQLQKGPEPSQLAAAIQGDVVQGLRMKFPRLSGADA